MSQISYTCPSINETFKNKSILVTGATGLVGKVIVYKLLKSVESVKNVFILMRSKKGKSITERFDEMVTKSYGLFADLEKSSLQKLIAIEGDITIRGLGLNETDRNTIITNVSIVFHSAADVTFDMSLISQMKTNVLGTKNIIDLCRELNNLDVFCHVSTTYSNPLEMVTEEEVYTRTDHILDILDFTKDNEWQFNEKELMTEFPNTYTFTKNLAENLVNREFNRGGLKTTIVRPGIVSTSIREPFCGWFDSLTSIAGGALLVGSGLVRHSLAKPDITADAIPVDIVANTCIAAAWNTINKYPSEIRVYNCNTSCLGAGIVNTIEDKMHEFVEEYPIWNTIRPRAKLAKNFHWIEIFFIQIFLELCFAYFLDFLLLIIGRKRMVVHFIKTFQRLMKASECFISHQWYYTNNNFVKLSEELIGTDKQTFDCEVRYINWIQYMITSFYRTRKLLLKETDEDIYRAQIRYKILRIGYTILNHFLLYLILNQLLSLPPISGFNLLNNIGFNGVYLDIRNIGLFLLLCSSIRNIYSHLFKRIKRTPFNRLIIEHIENTLLQNNSQLKANF